MGNGHADNARLALITRWPEMHNHEDEARRAAEASTGRKMSKAEQQQLRRLWGDLASDGRTEEQATHVPDWVNPVLRNAAWQPLSSKPSIDTSDVSSLDQENFKRVVTQRLKKGSIIRVPVASEWGERDLQETFEKVWGAANMKFDMLGLCIVHCLQRTFESNVKGMVAPIQERCLDGRGGAQAIIDAKFNEPMKRLNVRMRIQKKEPSNPKCTECAAIGVNGDEGERMLKDLYRLHLYPAKSWGASKLLTAIYETAKALELHQVCEQMQKWCAVLGHYAVAMTAAYKMRPQAVDRATFKEHARLYVLKKALLRPGKLCWYDWQMWSALPKLFEQVGSLRLLSQEGMEGQQRLNNEISKRSNGWSNAGRIPNAIKAMGDIAKAAYMRVRAKLKPKPAEWMYQQQLLHFLADADETQSAAKALAAIEEGTMDWRDEFTPAWHAYMLFTCGYILRLVAARKQLAEAAEAERDVEPYYTRLLKEHNDYKSIDVPKQGLSEDEYLKQRRAARRAWYREKNTLYKHDFLEGAPPRTLVSTRPGVAVHNEHEDSDMEE